VFGWIFAAHQLGAGAGALAASLVHDHAKTYTPAWVGAGIICLIAAAVVLRIGHRRPKLPKAADLTATASPPPTDQNH
jgi:predicted MFS family arabinose efflux permease